MQPATNSFLPKSWSADEHNTWHQLFERLDGCRKMQAVDLFAEGVTALGLSGTGIPDLVDVNRRLLAATGWTGYWAEGLVDGAKFLVDLGRKQFPVGGFIRAKNDLNYTPAPDVFHDLYGHLPFLVNRDYANFCYELGLLSQKFQRHPKSMRMCERLFWFGVEFPLVETPKGRRIFGGGILSSFGESNYALSAEPEVVPFDLKDITERDYNINEMQRRLYLLSSPHQLYDCLPELKKLLERTI